MAQINTFIYANLSNTTAVNQATFEDIYGSIVKDQASSALWFYPAAVGITHYRPYFVLG